MCALDHETLPRRRARARHGSHETPAPSRTKKMLALINCKQSHVHWHLALTHSGQTCVPRLQNRNITLGILLKICPYFNCFSTESTTKK